MGYQCGDVRPSFVTEYSDPQLAQEGQARIVQPFLHGLGCLVGDGPAADRPLQIGLVEVGKPGGQRGKCVIGGDPFQLRGDVTQDGQLVLLVPLQQGPSVVVDPGEMVVERPLREPEPSRDAVRTNPGSAVGR